MKSPLKSSVVMWVVITNIFTALFCYFIVQYDSAQDLMSRTVCDNKKSELHVSSRITTQRNLTDGTLKQSNCSHMDLGTSYINVDNNMDTVIEFQDSISCRNVDETQETLPIADPQHIDQHLLTTIVAITPTYKRLTQKLDLTTVCHTVMHIPNLLWIVIEDSKNKSSLVERLLARCKVKTVHLNAVTSKSSKAAGQRGMEQRNAGLKWIRQYCKDNCQNKCNGVVYFMDDDNRYDLRLFEQMRNTKTVSVFPVAFSGGLAFEGPICKDSKAVKWQAVWQSKERHVPVDMAAFVININLIIEKPKVLVGYQPGNKRRSKKGFMESDLIKSIGHTREQIECKGVSNEVLVWHVKTTTPFLSYKNHYPNVEV